jgi:hypothetical protein
MKHASEKDLLAINSLLVKLRALPMLTERKPGIFYHKATAFLHFHSDASGLFADVKMEGEFVRFDITNTKGQAALMAAVNNTLQT